LVYILSIEKKLRIKLYWKFVVQIKSADVYIVCTTNKAITKLTTRRIYTGAQVSMHASAFLKTALAVYYTAVGMGNDYILFSLQRYS
jgi:hypothetical protein